MNWTSDELPPLVSHVPDEGEEIERLSYEHKEIVVQLGSIQQGAHQAIDVPARSQDASEGVSYLSLERESPRDVGFCLLLSQKAALQPLHAGKEQGERGTHLVAEQGEQIFFQTMLVFQVTVCPL